MSSVAIINADKTYTLDQFISMQSSDQLTYKNFAILEKYNNIEYLDHNLIDDYLTEFLSVAVELVLDDSQFIRYKYSPDLLSYDVYGTTQLDFVILALNDMVDPKEFTKKKIKMLYNSAIKELMSYVYNSNSGYVELNRQINGIKLNF